MTLRERFRLLACRLLGHQWRRWDVPDLLPYTYIVICDRCGGFYDEIKIG